MLVLVSLIEAILRKPLRRWAKMSSLRWLCLLRNWQRTPLVTEYFPTAGGRSFPPFESVRVRIPKDCPPTAVSGWEALQNTNDPQYQAPGVHFVEKFLSHFPAEHGFPEFVEPSRGIIQGWVFQLRIDAARCAE